MLSVECNSLCVESNKGGQIPGSDLAKVLARLREISRSNKKQCWIDFISLGMVRFLSYTFKSLLVLSNRLVHLL